MNSYNSDLSDCWVVVTRPAHQADGVIGLIEQSGGNVIRFPVTEIEAPANTTRLRAVLGRLSEFEWLVFVSANAVRMGLQAIADIGIPRPDANIVAVGARTAQALRHEGWHVHVVGKPPYTSEALLAEPAMQTVNGQRFLIFRGEAGRELLRETLTERGAHVEYAECYRRVPTRSDPALLEKAWSRPGQAVIMVTSIEGVENLINIVGHENLSRLLQTSLVVAGGRVAKSVHDRGWLAPVVIAADATDNSMLAALHTWRSKRSRATP